MGIASGDLNNDNLLDYYVTNLGRNSLLKQNEDGTFTDIADEAGVANTFSDTLLVSGWGTSFIDYNNDGLEDLFVVNGHIPSAKFLKNPIKTSNKLYKNLGNEQFEDITISANLNDSLIARGSVKFDMDNDGDQDIVIANIRRLKTDTAIFQIYENLDNEDFNWLSLKLEGSTSNIDAIGSKIYLFSNNKVRVKEINGGGSYASWESTRVHFGLGSMEIVDSIQVIWPEGNSQMIYNTPINQLLLIRQDAKSYEILGCLDENNADYNPEATVNYGCRQFIITSIEEEGNLGEIKVYPNPSSRNIYISFPLEIRGKPVQIQVLDVLGRSVIHQQTIAKEKFTTNVSWKPGVYIVEVSGINFRKSLRLIVQ